MLTVRMPPLTKSEALVYELCQQSFLSPWSYPRPRRRNGKELCDVLVMCEPDVVVFSVKDIEARDTGDPKVEWTRWQRKAIDESAAQLYGAARELGHLDRIIQEDGARGLALPPKERRRVHLVAVAVGGRRTVPLYSGDLGKGYVHVFDESALDTVLGELDTISDFATYIVAVRTFHDRGGRAISAGGEENFLAAYLHQGRTLPSDADTLMLDGDLWSSIQKKPEFQARKAEDRVSYAWDRLIAKLFEEHEIPLRTGEDVSDPEQIVRTMAREDRFARRLLANAYLAWLGRRQHGARMLRSPSSGVVYVFLTTPRDWLRSDRTVELQGRCYVARGLHPDATTVIGIATEVYDPSGFSLDAVYLYMPTWTAEDDDKARYARETFDWFHTPEMNVQHVDEFPQPLPSAKGKRKPEWRRPKRQKPRRPRHR